MQQALQFALSVVLSRLLLPEDFGLVGMVAILTGFAVLLSDMGFSASLVQRDDLQKDHLDAVFWVSIATGGVLYGLFFLCAPAIASFYEEKALVPIVRLVALVFFIHGSRSVHSALLNRGMRFSSLVKAEVTAVGVGGVAGVGSALLGQGALSLVWMSIAKATTEALVLWSASGWLPSLRFNGASARDLAGFSINLVGARSLNYWVRNADNLIIGRAIGPASLGLYMRAYGTLLFPLNQIVAVLTRVLFPVMARMQNDQARTRRAYLTVLRTISILAFPVVSGLLVVAPYFVVGLYGKAWAGAVPIVQVLCVAGFVQVVVATMGVIYQSQGRTDIMFRWQLVKAPIIIGSFFMGVLWGSIGVASCFAAVTVLLAWPNIAIPSRLIGLGPSNVMTACAPGLMLALLMSAVVFGITFALPADISDLGALAITVPIGIITYVLLLLLFRPLGFQEAVVAVKDLWRGRRRRAHGTTGAG